MASDEDKSKDQLISELKEVRQRISDLEVLETMHRRAENQLREKENIIESASSPIATADLEGRMTYGNPAFLKMWGFSGAEEFLGRPFPEFWMVGDRLDEITHALYNVGTWFGEIKARRKDGALFDAQVSAAMVYDKGGAPVALVSTSTDITDRQRAKEQLKVLVSDLERVNNELQDFAYIVSHDLKAPLRGISLLADWLSEDYSEVLDEGGREYLDKLLVRTRRMHNLIDGILQYSRVGRLEADPQRLDTEKLVGKVIDTLSVPEHITVRVEGNLPSALYDMTLFIQILLNLIGNAIKYIERPEGEVIVSCTDRGRVWEFCVRDNGVGIEERHFERIFKIFQSLKPVSEMDSTGIGLALVKKIVEQNRGVVWVESIVGQGSAFFFTVPKRTADEVPGSSDTVLIIDDNMDYTMAAAAMLRHEGHKVLSAANGPEAFKILEEHKGEIYLTLMDVRIPGEDALERYRILRRLHPGMKSIHTTGSQKVDVIKRRDKAGVNTMLNKRV